MSRYLIDRILDAADKEASDAVDEPVIMPQRASAPAQGDELWGSYMREGELAVDVYQTPTTLVILAAIAGAKPKDISIEIQNDVVTIRGLRQIDEVVPEDDYLYRECFWGPFSRSLVLPVEVVAEEARATFQSGILKIVIPKAAHALTRRVQVIEEEEIE